MRPHRIAHFSMEIGLESGMPTYSGGLGVLAGDTIRAAAELTVPLVAATPTPRVITLEATAAGEEAFLLGAARRKATHSVVKVKLGGVAGLVAPVVGKQPPDSHVWVLGGTAPAFVKFEGPLAVGGPVWRIALATPVWPAPPPQAE